MEAGLSFQEQPELIKNESACTGRSCFFSHFWSGAIKEHHL
jgi:hypothetical protein